MKAAEYYRKNKSWQVNLGKVGQVISKTTIRIAEPSLQKFTPYSLVLVDFKTEKKLLIGVDSDYAIGDFVKCVFRKLQTQSQASLIIYGIKAQKI